MSAAITPALRKRLKIFDSSEFLNALGGIRRGFEKECLRVDLQGQFSNKPHPAALGSSLKNPMITTDYSEALLEFITPPTVDLQEPFRILEELHQYTYAVLDQECLWAGSMPCVLAAEQDIPIAQYGSSHWGRLKHIYRRGLGYRYGRMMQTIAGVHYNFSLSQEFWQHYHAYLGSPLGLKEFISEQYLGLIRNALRWKWLLPLLFGASPAVSPSFFKGQNSTLELWGEDTLVGSQATSLRLSDLGYTNSTQSKFLISYNTLEEFVRDLQHIVHLPVPEYSRIPLKKDGEYCQLSQNLLQIEAEHYALLRPKRVLKSEERLLTALTREGIEYIEVRAVDLNPFSPIGIEPETTGVLDAFLLLCLFTESPPLSDQEQYAIAAKHAQVVQWGRKPGLTLTDGAGRTREVLDWASELLEGMAAVAIVLDKSYRVSTFSEACQRALEQVKAPDTLPSAQILQEMKEHQESHCAFVQRWSLKHRDYFLARSLSPDRQEYLHLMAQQSVLAQQALERADTVSFEEYLRRYLEAV